MFSLRKLWFAFMLLEVCVPAIRGESTPKTKLYLVELEGNSAKEAKDGVDYNLLGKNSN